MPQLSLVTDTTADLPAELQRELGVHVVAGRFAFDEHTFVDGEMDVRTLYERMEREGRPPRPFGVPEASWREAFERALEASEAVICLVMPFDVAPSFTTASAAALSMEDAPIKVLNPGVASAGLCSFVTSLAAGVGAGWDRAAFLAAVDSLEPLSDTVFVPRSVEWLERAGRLRLIEDRIGEIGQGVPVVRVGTRITGISAESDHSRALHRAVETAGVRAGDQAPLIVTIDHAAAPELAERAAEMMRRRWNCTRTIVTELSATIGSQLGPGALGIGVAPMAPE